MGHQALEVALVDIYIKDVNINSTILCSVFFFFYSLYFRVKHYSYIYIYAYVERDRLNGCCEKQPFAISRCSGVKSMAKQGRPFSALSRPVHASFPGVRLEQHGKKTSRPYAPSDVSPTVAFFATYFSRNITPCKNLQCLYFSIII